MPNFLNQLLQSNSNNKKLDPVLLEEILHLIFKILKEKIIKNKEEIQIPEFLDLKYKKVNYKATKKKKGFTRYSPFNKEVILSKKETFQERTDLADFYEIEEDILEFKPDKSLIIDEEQ